ncbi:multidrug resistance-associated ABC transporter [Crassisporium funariophilum]|nr:multidrug resistance-associated ABC transporter [Crassisporium funariophilum]
MVFAWHNPFRPSPAPPAFGAGKVLPEASSSYISRLVFHWIGGLLDVGFTRPLEKEDFWALPTNRHTENITDSVEALYYSRCPPEKRPYFMRDTKSDGPTYEADEKGPTNIASEGENKTDPIMEPSASPEKIEVEGEKGREGRLSNSERETRNDKKQVATDSIPKYDESLFKALHRTFFRRIWTAGSLLLISDTLRTTTPLLNKVLLTWLVESYVYFRLSDSDRALASVAGFTKPRGIGYGIGLAFALFVMQESASLMANHFMLASMTTGLYIRTGIVGNIFRKSLRLSGRARAEHTVGQITTMISTDATQLDMFSAFAHHLWASPIQIVIGVGLLIGNLGYSALVGLGVLIIGLPIQFLLIVIMFNQRKKGVKITDRRVRLTTEVLHGIRLIKLYGWEGFYTRQISHLREGEIKTIRKSAFAASLLIAMFTFVPILAGVLSFITYALTGHDLNVAIIFSSLQLFTIIRIPLIIFPFVLKSLADALVSFERITKFLTADELPEPYRIEQASSLAVHVDGDFEWETTFNEKGEIKKTNDSTKGEASPSKKELENTSEKKTVDKQQSKWWKSSPKQQADKDALPLTTDDTTDTDNGGNKQPSIKPEEPPFGLKNLQLDIVKGSFVAIVGRVGCGKSSILQALIGEMRRTKGEVVFGGSVAYVPQVPWIRNATLRENILFGQKDDDEKFHNVIQACSLQHDLTVLPQGENTAIGEKGINLSGGQKARVSLARAAYSQSDIVLLDDPLSAVDAYVGKSILEDCILAGPLASRTRILVTHALHVLDKTDYIYVMDNGAILEQGTYSELLSDSIMFSRLIEEYGSADSAGQSSQHSGECEPDKQEGQIKKSLDDVKDVLMQLEERNVGAVSWDIYKKYLRFAGGLTWVPLVLLLLMLTEGSNVATTLVLGFWTGSTINGFTQGNYMAVYAGLGVALAVSTFALTYAFVVIGLIASLNLYKAALSGVLSSPTSFFDTTPMGRILSRLSKDQDTIDGELPLTLMQFLSTFTSVLGTIALVFYTFPYLGIIFLPMSILYYIVSIYYRRSSVETKRLDSLLRSILYGSYSETLTGLATIRAYREQRRCVKDAEQGLDMQNRAYYMTIAMQRWLAVRLDFFSNVLVLGIALFAAGFRSTISPSKIGVVLTYTLGVTQVFSEMISMFATCEQNMNAVERVLHYSELPPEGGNGSSSTEPPASWPANGMIKFSNVKLAYREGLPSVLKGIDFLVNPGEKIGIVGRTGAGKSSLIQALLRMVELQDGKIEIDGLDIATMGLNVLRTRLALVPQDTTLFLGTMRDNLDPQRLRTDAELISVLQRAWLLPKSGPVDPAVEAKFSLDSMIGDEGVNYSAGEKQLLALCRALVKNSRIIILDEATSNVDVETDSKVQRTIQTEFASSTLLCIAHRLNTIAHCDRVIVMDGGKVAEFDSVMTLFDRRDSIFRSLCDEANLQRVDIVKLRGEPGGSS